MDGVVAGEAHVVTAGAEDTAAGVDTLVMADTLVIVDVVVDTAQVVDAVLLAAVSVFSTSLDVVDADVVASKISPKERHTFCCSFFHFFTLKNYY